MHNIVLFAERDAAAAAAAATTRNARHEKEEVRGRFPGQEHKYVRSFVPSFAKQAYPPSRPSGAESAALILPPPTLLDSGCTDNWFLLAGDRCSPTERARCTQTRVSSRMSVSSFLGESASMHARP